MKKIILLVLMLVSVAAAAFASSDTPATTDTGGRTELVFVIDKSGSMSGLESDTIGGFNSMLHKQKNINGNEALVTLVLFDTKYNVIHDRVSLESVNDLTNKEYFAGGATALLDAVGMTINRIERVPGIYDKGTKVLFVIITDGYENSSKEYTRDKVKSMITEKQKEHNWEFVFLGANIDAVSEAGNLGIAPTRAASYSNDTKGVQTNYDAVSNLASDVRNNKKISANWKQAIEKHYNETK